MARLRPRRAGVRFPKILPLVVLVFCFYEEWLRRFVGLVLPPVWLHENGVDLLEIDDFGLISHGFYHGSDAEVFYASEDSFGTSQDEIESGLGEGVMRESDAIQLALNKLYEVLVRERLQLSGIGDSTA